MMTDHHDPTCRPRCYAAPWLVLAGLATTGCYGDEQLNPVPLTTAPTGEPDGGTGDAGPPLRSLVARKLFGTMPLDNRFHDPGFTMINGTGWMPYDYDYDTMNQVARAHLARTPGNQPALRLWAPTPHPEASVVGEAKGAAGPVVVSIWLGRTAGQNPTDKSGASLLGLFLDDTPGAIDLAPDTQPAPVTLDGLSWQRLSVQCTDGPVAVTYLRVVNSAEHPLYLTSPILVPVDEQRDLSSTHSGRRRALRTAETKALRAAAEHKRRQLGGDLRPKR
jgi:hypothetical protein